MVLFPPAMPSTAHKTVVSLAPVTDAVNCCVPWASTLAVAGLMVTETGGGGAVTVTFADADLVGSAKLVEVMDTVAGFGKDDGPM
jgi:hypothetical protein